MYFQPSDIPAKPTGLELWADTLSQSNKAIQKDVCVRDTCVCIVLLFGPGTIYLRVPRTLLGHCLNIMAACMHDYACMILARHVHCKNLIIKHSSPQHLFHHLLQISVLPSQSIRMQLSGVSCNLVLYS